ncbi:MAG: hypothetical protein FWH18_00525 [Marinilabiliaceae bacterium]|nr:hypothetical protein [Marinilabiliaceae bacterium]
MQSKTLIFYLPKNNNKNGIFLITTDRLKHNNPTCHCGLDPQSPKNKGDVETSSA